jgi:mannose-6-phosphate isomerase-like protein (cupin superfamily)
MNSVQYGAVVAGALLLAFPGSLRQQPTNPAAAVVQSPIMVRAEAMKWEDCTAALPHGPQCASLEGDRTVANMPFTYRLKLPDGYRIPPHVHPGDGHLTVIAGTLNIGWGDRFDVEATTPMPAGSFIVIPRGTRHSYWTQGETIVQSHGIGPWGVTYVNPADDPRKR